MTHAAAPLAAAIGRSQRWALGLLLLGAAGIAFSPIFVRLSEAGPTATAFWRVALAVPLLWIWMSADRGPRRRRRPASRGDFARLALAGLCFAGDLISWHWSLRFTSVANSTLFANFSPLWVTLAAWLILGERFTRTFLIGLGFGLAGAVLLMGDSLALGAGHLLGDGLALVTALFYAGYLLIVARLRAEFSTATIMAWSGAVTAVVVLPAALASGETFLPATVYGWAVLLGLAWVSHAGGQSLIAAALAHLPAAFSSVGLLAQPLMAAGLAWLILAEGVSATQALGGIVILVGIFLARLGSRGGAPAAAP